jgi:hypothetical protein
MGATTMAFMNQCQGDVFTNNALSIGDVKVTYDVVGGSHNLVEGEIELPLGYQLPYPNYRVALKDGKSLKIHVTSCPSNVAKFYGIIQ